MTDVPEESARWPKFSATATRLAVAGVAGFPMQFDHRVIGALNIYPAEPRQWSDEGIAVARCCRPANNCVINAATLRQREQLSEQATGSGTGRTGGLASSSEAPAGFRTDRLRVPQWAKIIAC